MFLSLLPPTTIHVQCHPQGLPAPLRPRQAPTVLVHPYSPRIAPITCPTRPPSLHRIPRLIQLVSSQPRMCHLIPLTNTFPSLSQWAFVLIVIALRLCLCIMCVLLLCACALHNRHSRAASPFTCGTVVTFKREWARLSGHSLLNVNAGRIHSKVM